MHVAAFVVCPSLQNLGKSMRIYQTIRLAIYLTVPTQRREGENWGGMPERSGEPRPRVESRGSTTGQMERGGRNHRPPRSVVFALGSLPSALRYPAGAMFLLWRKKLVGSYF